MSLRRIACASLLVLLPVSSCLAGEESEGIARLLLSPAAIDQASQEAMAEGPDAEMTRLHAFVQAELFDEDELIRRLGEKLESLVSAEDIAAFAPFHRAGGVAAFNDLREAYPTWGPDRIVDELPRGLRRSFTAFRESGALERAVATLQHHELKATFMAYFTGLYCRAARDVAADRFGELADEVCSASTLFTSPLPAAMFGSDDAVAVLEMFNIRELMQHALVTTLAEMGGDDPTLAAKLESWVARYSTPDELVHVAAAVVDRHALPGDLVRVAAFARSESGVRFTAALRGLTPEEMGRATENMPESVLEDLLPLVHDGSLDRVSQAMNVPEMETAGRDWGRRLICRVPIDELPEEFAFVRGAGICTNADGTLEAPVVPGDDAENVKAGAS